MSKCYSPVLKVTICLMILLSACVPDNQKPLTEVVINKTSPLFQRVTNHQHNKQTDSLITLLSDKNPTARYLAAKAFASHQDPKALDSLYALLNDPVIKIRAIASYAIGQQGLVESEQALIRGFRQKDTMAVDNEGNGAILASLGKVASAPMADFIAQATTLDQFRNPIPGGYRPKDTLLLEGQIESLLRFSHRNILSAETTQKALNILRNPAMTPMARLYAAHYFARAKDLDIESFKFQLAETFVEEKNPNIKMALASSLKHTNDPEIQTILLNQLDLEQDYRVTCNIIRTLTNYDYPIVKQKIIELLKSDNTHIALTAVNYISQKGDPNDASQYRAILKDSIPWQIRTKLYESIFKSLPYYYTKTKNATRWQLQQDLKDETNPKAIAQYLHALGEDPENYKFIMDYIDKTEDTVIKTAGIEALGTIVSHKDFNFVYQSISRSNRRKILTYYVEALKTNDEGIVGAVANSIATPEANLKELIDSTNFLIEAKQKLKMPAQIESIHAIEKALAHIRGVNNPELSIAQNFKPINWDIIKKYNNSVKAIVKTDKGPFTIDLKMKEAPISAINFIELAESNYFDNKIFHRVVPNFVIQTGSPRGDNYGGSEYVITSEVGPQKYDDAGYVGMASAGLHTESTQWFVTHSPTPHLDGKYTIFGKVQAQDMKVIHDIQVGDKILDIIITDL